MTDKELISIVDAKAKKLWDEINTGHEYSIIDSYNQFYGICMEIAEMVQEEPVSKDFETALAEMIDNAQKNVIEPWVVAAQWKDELIELAKSEEPVNRDLGEYINELSKQFPEVSFAKLSRIAVRVAKWQKEKDQKK